MNYSRLYLYMGVMARGEFRKGKIIDYFNGPIGPSTLLKIEEFPQQYIVRPILKPLWALGNWEHPDSKQVLLESHRFLPDLTKKSAMNDIVYISRLSILLREKGWDCDNLIDQGFAICHPDYKISLSELL